MISSLMTFEQRYTSVAFITHTIALNSLLRGMELDVCKNAVR